MKITAIQFVCQRLGNETFHAKFVCVVDNHCCCIVQCYTVMSLWYPPG